MDPELERFEEARLQVMQRIERKIERVLAKMTEPGADQQWLAGRLQALLEDLQTTARLTRPEPPVDRRRRPNK
ncbi:MAG: hypothetical protein ABSD03_03025 [Vulcanimicrobiaceae bacterium]